MSERPFHVVTDAKTGEIKEISFTDEEWDKRIKDEEEENNKPKIKTLEEKLADLERRVDVLEAGGLNNVAVSR